MPSVAERYGGPSTAIRGMTSAIARRGVEVTVATTDADGAARLPVPLDRAVVSDGVEYRYFARTLPGEYKFSWPLTRWLLDRVHEFDVVHVHALFSYSTIPGCRLARRAGVPYVLRPLGTLGAWSLDQKSWKKAPYLALVERRHLAGAAAIHVTSGAEADAVAELGYGTLTREIPLGVDVVSEERMEHRIADALERRQAGSAAPLRLLFLSRLHPKKGLPLLFDAIARARVSGAPAIELTIAGDGEPRYVADLQQLAGRTVGAGTVRFVGHLEGGAKEAAFDATDLFVLPSSNENFGIAAAEALARGVPVILSEEVGIAPAVAAAGAGAVVPLQVEALASTLVRLAVDPRPLGAMSRAARSLSERDYSWLRSADALIALYSEIVSARIRGR
ncbi:MAG TPA: glycosyltransferase [Gemmatimonadaceae bacterium]|nr:glycosyltransferase [Gemmatimonadaceae bacterium]